MWNNKWRVGIDYPEWGNTEVYKKTIGGHYLIANETPRQAYKRVAEKVAYRLDKPELAADFFSIRPTDYSKANEGEDYSDIW